MSVTNPSPSQIADDSWDIEPAIRGFTVSIPTRPSDHDLAGIIVLAKAGTGQALTFPDDVFYKGAWADLIFVNTDASNNVLLPNQAYTIKVAAFDEFGTDSLSFSNAKETITLQVVESDIADQAVTVNKIPDEEITSSKISGLVADKITAGTITGSTLQTATSGKRFKVTTDTNEARFYGVNDTTTNDITQLVSIGAYNSATVYTWPQTSAGDTTATFTGGAQVKSTSFYGIEWTSAGTATLYIDDLIPGALYTFSCVNSAGSNVTINTGGLSSAVPSGTANVIIACTRPYIEISNTGTIGGTEYITLISVQRAETDYLISVGSSTTTKNAGYFVAKNRALTAYSYSTDFTAYIKNSATGTGVAVIGTATRASQDDTMTTKGGYFTAGAGTFGYTGSYPMDHVFCVEGKTNGKGVGVYGNASGGLDNGYAAFKSNGDSDFRGGIVYFKSYTVATLPTTSTAGGMIYVSDESGGAVMAFSDGTNWRRVTDRAIVS